MKNEHDTKMEVRKIGVRKVSEQSGVHHQTLYRWLKGSLSPTLKTYAKIVEAVEELKSE